MHSKQQDIDTRGAADTLVEWLKTLRLGTPVTSGALAVVPVYGGEAEKPLPYRTLAHALGSGEALITEQAYASVPTLQVMNHGALPILILDGEEVAGGRQNRVVNTTLLVPAKTAFDLPVTCIEHGRWHEVQAGFDSGEAVHPSLRRQKMEQVTASFAAAAAPIADQHAVWEEVAERHRRTGTQSPTHSLRDAYARRAADLEAAQRALRCPEDEATGVVALLEGRALCADLFDRPEALRHFWPRLVRSYALEAVDVPKARRQSVASARRLLERAAKAARTPFASPGLGVDVRISGNGSVGAALLHKSVVLHAALFRQRGQHPHAGGLSTPSQRARRLEGG